jgi:protein TonB
MGASLLINGALVLGVLHMNIDAPMVQMEETGMLVSLGDPHLTTTDNATAPDARPAPTPAPDAQPAPASPELARQRPLPPLPDGYLSAAASRPPAPSPSTSEATATAPTSTSTAREAPAPAGAKAMVATAAKPPAGSANAHSVQAHAGSSTSYAARVRAWLESNKTYPKAARLRKQQGVVRLVFVIDRAGHVLDCRLVGPSGYALLDQEALAMVARSDPFPAPPHTLKGDRIELDAPVEFSLER